MGQKINPFGYRLGITENHRSKWFSDSNKVGERYRDFVLEDDAIRKAMSKDLERAGVSRIVIERTRDRASAAKRTSRSRRPSDRSRGASMNPSRSNTAGHWSVWRKSRASVSTR